MLRRLAAVLILTASAATAQPALLTPAPVPEVTLTPRQAEILGLLRAEPGVSDVHLVTADVSLLATGADVRVDLPDAPPVVVAMDGGERRSADDLSWTGRAAAARLADTAEAVFVAHLGWLTGSLRRGDAVYTIRPLTGGLHAIARVAGGRPEHTDDFEAFVAQNRDAIDRDRAADVPAEASHRNGLVEVDVLVAYTARVAVASADPYAFAQFAIAQSNATYAVSGIDVRLTLATAFESPTPETTLTSTDLTALQNMADGRFDEVHGVRDVYGADLVVLLGSGYTEACGRGYLNPGATFGFSVVEYGCAASGYTFAHEVGHNFGATHDPYVVTAPAYPYGQGSVDLAGRWRTVMAYNDQCADAGVSCTTVGYWSAPSVIYPDATAPVNVGPTGDAATRDNVRVLRERAATVSAFRARPAAATLGAPAPISVVLTPDQTATRTIEIRNTAAAGSRPLDWAVAVAGTDPAECAGPVVVQQGQISFYTNSTAGGSEYGQSVTPPCSGVVRSIAPQVYGPGSAGTSWTATLRLYAGTGTGGTPLGTAPVASVNGPGSAFIQIPLPTPVAVTRGQPATWFLDLESGIAPVLYSTADPLAGGAQLRSPNGLPSGAMVQTGNDMTFQMTLGPLTHWATPSVTRGTTAPGTVSSVPLAITAAGLTPGVYPLTLLLTTSDPSTPTTSVPLTLTVATTAAETSSPDGALVLDAPAPNPARGPTTLGFTLAETGPVRLAVIDLLGREVAVVLSGEAAAGRHTARLDPARLAPGVYVVRLSAGTQAAVRRLVIVR